MRFPTLLSVIVVSVILPSTCDGFGISSKNSVPLKVHSGVYNEVNVDYKKMSKVVAASILGLGLACSSASPALAVSGGGLDFAGLDISGQDFSNNSKAFKGKDFTQVLAKATNFASSNLQGCRFYKAYLVNADFSNADIRGVRKIIYFLYSNTISNTNSYALYICLFFFMNRQH